MNKEEKNKLINWIKEEVKKANANGVVVGISGGIDSAVVAYLAKEAFPNNSIGIWMDINSSKEAKDNAFLIKEDLKINFLEYDLSDNWKELINKIGLKDQSIDENRFKIASGNTKSRLRMITLYQIAKIKNYLVLGTSNKDEVYMGFFTKWGDGSADLYPIANLNKLEVYELAKELKVNQKIIDAKPTADLWEDQNDENEMGVTYQDINNYLKGNYIEENKKAIIENWHNSTEHKRIKGLKKP